MKKQDCKPRLIPFHFIRVSVPRKFFLRCLDKPDFLTWGEIVKISRKVKEFDRAKKRLEHIISVGEKCLLKKSSTDKGYL